VRNFGSGFEEAKANGASDAEALTAAGLSGLMNSMVEVSGGIEALPGRAKTGGFRAWAESALQEGLEEPVQGVVSNAVSKGIYDPARPVVSLTDPYAVINPYRMGQEFATGATVGAILSGAELAVDGIQRIDLSRVATNDARKVKELSVANGLQIKAFIYNAFQKKNDYQYLSVGKVSSQLVADIQTVGIDIAGYDHAIRDNDL